MFFIRCYKSKTIVFAFLFLCSHVSVAQVKIANKGDYIVVLYDEYDLGKRENEYIEPKYDMPLYSPELDRYWRKTNVVPIFKFLNNLFANKLRPACPVVPTSPIAPPPKMQNTSGKLTPENCTAHIVSNAQSGPVLLTAAHCVSKIKSMLFRREADKKSFTAFCAAFQKDYEVVVPRIEQVALDYAFVKLKPQHQRVEKLEMEFSKDPPKGAVVKIFGYPHNWGEMKIFRGLKSKTNHTSNKNVNSIDQNMMNSGASGGSWIMKNDGKIHAITSAVHCCHCSSPGCKNVDCDGKSNQKVYGPILGAEAKKLFDFVKNSCK